jgi:hypothetical protein
MCPKKNSMKKKKKFGNFFSGNEEFLKEYFPSLFFGILIKFHTTKMLLWVSKDYETSWGHP